MKLNEDYIDDNNFVNSVLDTDEDTFPFYNKSGDEISEYFPMYAATLGIKFTDECKDIVKWFTRQIRLACGIFNLSGFPDYALKTVRYTRGIKVIDPTIGSILENKFNGVDISLNQYSLIQAKMFYITFGFSTPDRWNHTQGIKFLQMLVRGYMREDERLNRITIDYMENDDTEPIEITGKEKLEKLSRIRSADYDVQDMYLQIIEFFDTTGLPGSRK